MDITTISMEAPAVTRDQVQVAWVYANGRRLTGHRWCYLFMPDGETLICSMFGNPAGDNFEVTSNFRTATENELAVLDFLEKLSND